MYSTTGSDLSILPYINNLGIRINIFMKYHWLAELLKENNVEKYYSTKQKIPLCSAFTSWITCSDVGHPPQKAYGKSRKGRK